MKNKTNFEGYSQWMTKQNKSEGTIREYLYVLKKLPDNPEEYLIVNHKKKMIIAAYRSYLKYLKHIKQITSEELLDSLETYKLPKRRGNSHTKKQGKAYPQAQWNSFIKNAPNRVAKLGIWMGFNFGLRLSEIIHLRVQDINLEAGELYITGTNRSDNWHPKHFHERTLPITRAQKNILTKWIDKRDSLNHDYLLWTPRNDNQVTSRNFQRWCKRADPNLKPHDLRRSYATNLYYATNKDTKIVQLLLGHSNIGITSEYLCLEENEAFDKARRAMAL